MALFNKIFDDKKSIYNNNTKHTQNNTKLKQNVKS